MLPHRIELDGLSRIPVTLAGRWHPDRKPGDWDGLATAAVPLVGVSFLAHLAGVQWCKGGRANPEGQRVRLRLGWHSDRQNVSVGFSVGNGQSRWSTLFRSLPEMSEQAEFSTGVIAKITDIPGPEPVTCHALFLQGDQTKVGRNGLWHLRPDFALHIPEPFRKLLTYGRSGVLDAV